MRLSVLLVCAFLSASTAFAQDDPVVMQVAGTPVHLSEFEYAYHKNYPSGKRGTKDLEEFAERYLDYKLKVQAALDAHLDTLSLIRKDYEICDDRQAVYSYGANPRIEAETRSLYDAARKKVEASGGLVKVAHILLALRQNATEYQRREAEQRADSIYRALLNGADFSEMASKFSDDAATANNGGELPWISKGQTVKKFEDAVFNMKVGDISRPILSEFGYHIVLLKGKQPFYSYEARHQALYRQVEAQDLRNAVMSSGHDTGTKVSALTRTATTVPADSMPPQAISPKQSQLLREYRESLLIYEITNRTIWEKASHDEKALAAYYKRHKKAYRWEQPRFKGVAFYVRNYNDAKKARQILNGKPSSQWASLLRQTFNNDTTEGIKLEEGLFLPGDNPLVDRIMFKKDVRPSPFPNFHMGSIYGKLLKKGPEAYTDVRSLVVADYLEHLEQEWVSSLRKRYRTTINRSVLTSIK